MGTITKLRYTKRKVECEDCGGEGTRDIYSFSEDRTTNLICNRCDGSGRVWEPQKRIKSTFWEGFLVGTVSTAIGSQLVELVFVLLGVQL